MSVPRTCSHGVPFGKDDHCIGCELVWHRSGLQYALEKAERHRRAIARLEASADAPSGVTATGVSADPGGTETKPEQNLHEKGSEG